MRKIIKIVLWISLALAAILAFNAWRNWDTIHRVMLGGLKVYETAPPALPAQINRPAILVFSKTNGFRHEEAIPAGNVLFAKLAKDNGWGHFQTENGATFSPAILARFDAVIFNNTSGDVFTPAQRAAFKAFLENGGGYVGIHAAGDNSHDAWGWYVDTVIGTHFIGHPMDPQFQKATMRIEERSHPATRNLPASIERTDEWYSFDKSPRRPGITVLATLDEKTYVQKGVFGQELAMGTDHPIAWWRCVGKGRALYSAGGHTAASFNEPEMTALLTGAVRWALKLEGDSCSLNRIADAVVAVETP
ncbi:ThuA domain-containing protein [Novosphingobium sp. AAP83]|uniref:ThuA domain-containing protein n=1 Tax=Novosphingobium sp. AAP83 TaxID=1523425 RepID=UPI0006B91FF3|nr:ThuA domain-containing protein [Novosphingobium sp. AAP83]